MSPALGKGSRKAISEGIEADLLDPRIWATWMSWLSSLLSGPGGRPWLTLLGVLAISIQCLVVQTHVHGLAGPFAPNLQIVDVEVGGGVLAPGVHHSDGAPVSPRSHGGPVNCYICQSAVAGTAVLTSVPTLNSIQLSFIPTAVTSPSAASPSALRSHTWRSRAPPIQL